MELLEGVVVAMAPQNPPHAAGVARANAAILAAIAGRAHVRPQLALVLTRSVPEPDLAVVPGARRLRRSAPEHGTARRRGRGLLPEANCFSKGATYAAGGIPEYWIVNLVDDVVEGMRRPDPEAARYRDLHNAGLTGTVDAASESGQPESQRPAAAATTPPRV